MILDIIMLLDISARLTLQLITITSGDNNHLLLHKKNIIKKKQQQQ